MTFGAAQGRSNPGSQTLQISNGGGSTLSWSVSDNATWLTLSPTSGTSTGETDNVTVSVSIAGLSAGTYNGTITVTGAPPATGSPQTTAVTLAMGPPATSGPMLFTSSQTGNNEIWIRSDPGRGLSSHSCLLAASEGVPVVNLAGWTEHGRQGLQPPPLPASAHARPEGLYA